jgi:lipopolysaccharide transport system permease protein/teichoic acid transport system permease protein
MVFKAKPLENGIPFIVWMTTGMIPWFFLCDMLSSATGSVMEHSFLVKKIAFKVGLLPIVKIVSATIVHVVLIVFTIIMLAIYHLYPDIYFLQTIYYFIAAITFMLGVSWITSSLVVFFKDLTQIVQVILQIGFWGTPIFWSLSTIPDKWQFIFKLNPAYYITEGYRFSLIYKVPFWEHWIWGGYFWAITGCMIVLGSFIFTKLKPHFADVI